MLQHSQSHKLPVLHIRTVLPGFADDVKESKVGRQTEIAYAEKIHKRQLQIKFNFY